MNIRKQLGKSRFHRFYLVMLMSGQESFNSSSLFLRPILGHSRCFRTNLNHSKKGFSASFWDGGGFHYCCTSKRFAQNDATGQPTSLRYFFWKVRVVEWGKKMRNKSMMKDVKKKTLILSVAQVKRWSIEKKNRMVFCHGTQSVLERLLKFINQ